MTSSRLAAARSFSYYPGCSLTSSAKEYDLSARFCCSALGIELIEVEDWACCGASSAHSTNDLLSVALPSRDLSKAAESGRPLAAACAMCFSRLKIAANHLKDDAVRKEVARVAGHEIKDPPEVVHLLEILDSRLDSIQPKKPLTGLRVACYYGCLLVRPKAVGIDDAENPQLMDRLVTRLGAEALKWGFKTECCGAGMPLARPDMVRRLSHRILAQAKAAGADCVAVACPECHSNLDLHQGEIRAEYLDDTSMPVLYFTELLGLALGGSAKDLGLHMHSVNPIPALNARGLA